MSEKSDFMKAVTILIDTREQVNNHIVEVLDNLGIMHESQKLDFGDYSFKVGDKTFSVACVIERKANIDELYGNVTTDRERIEKELETIARNLVDDPEAVRVTTREAQDDTVVLELRVAPDDMGRVIGKQGRIAKALRTVARAAASRKDMKVAVEID